MSNESKKLKTYRIMAKPKRGEWFVWDYKTEDEDKWTVYNDRREETMSLQWATKDNRTGWLYKMEMDYEQDGVVKTKLVVDI